MNNLTPLGDRYADRIQEITSKYNEKSYLELIYDIELIYLARLYDKLVRKKGGANIIVYLPTQFDYQEVKNIEATTKHDVVAVVKYLENQIQQLWVDESITIEACVAAKSLVHFALTSQDLVSMANTVMAKDVMAKITNKTNELWEACEKIGKFKIMGMTHGQKAVPIEFSSKITLYINRMAEQLGKMGNPRSRFGNGTIGQRYSISKLSDEYKDTLRFAATSVARDLDVETINSLQTDYYPYVVDCMRYITNTGLILENFSQDMWQYISRNWFIQKNDMTQAGSSTMSHKVNPIAFENAEGNFRLAIAMSRTIADSLVVSRFERDLVDITVMRNIGLAFSYYTIAVQSLTRGMDSITPNEALLKEIINNSHETLAESVNLILRTHKISNAYEISKTMFKGRIGLNRGDYISIIECSKFSNEIKLELLDLKL